MQQSAGLSNSQRRSQSPQAKGMDWSKEEMVALTEIFKNIVLKEIETKQVTQQQQTTSANTKQTNNSLHIDRQSPQAKMHGFAASPVYGDSELIAKQNSKMTELER